MKVKDVSTYKKIDNYTLSTYDLPLIWLTYPLFHFWHFTHLWFIPLLLCYPTFNANVTLTHKLIKNITQNRSNTLPLQKHTLIQLRSQCSVLEIMDWEPPRFWSCKQTEEKGDTVFICSAVAGARWKEPFALARDRSAQIYTLNGTLSLEQRDGGRVVTEWEPGINWRTF